MTRPTSNHQGDTVIGPPDAVRSAAREAMRLKTLERWKASFDNAAPDSPLLVSRLDLGGLYSYIVSFRIGPRITARIRLTAADGLFAEAIGIGESTPALPPYLPVPEIFTRLLTTPLATTAEFTLPNVDPFLVWRPCAQSLSIFAPFYLLRYGGDRLQYFDAISGRFFDSLTGGAGI